MKVQELERYSSLPPPSTASRSTSTTVTGRGQDDTRMGTAGVSDQKIQLLADWKPMLSTLFPQFFNYRQGDLYSTYCGEDLEFVMKLNDAAANGRKAELECLLGSRSAELINKAFLIWNTSTLYCACMDGSLPCVKLLLDRKHPVEEGNRFGTSPLVIAAMRNHGDVVFELIAKGKAVLTNDAVIVAAQWKSRSALSAMFCSGALTKELMAIAWDIALKSQDVSVMEFLAEMKESSPVEFAADTMNIPALKRLANRAENGVTFPTYVQWKKAMVKLGRSKVKMVRPMKDFRECKDAINAGTKHIYDTTNLLLRLRLPDPRSNKNDQQKVTTGDGNTTLLALEAPKAMSLVFEHLGFIGRKKASNDDISLQTLSLS